jgi:Fic family protein
MPGHQWKPIEDLPDKWRELCSPDLQSLAQVWLERKAELEGSDALKEFNDRLKREWAIETGIIENLYEINRGTTQILILKGIEASLVPASGGKSRERVFSILKDQEETLDGLFDFVASRRELSASYVKELHSALTRNQDTVEAVNGLGRLVEVPLLRGDWKKQPNSPTRPDGELHEYCPPVHVESEMDRLIQMHAAHSLNQVTPDVESAWLHHRFTQIHPFQDGNGRVARALASLVFLRAGWFPLLVNRDDIHPYLDSLELADAGELGELVRLFARLQRRALNNALSLSKSVLHEREPLQDVIAAAAARLSERKSERAERIRSRTLELAARIEAIAVEGLRSAAEALTKQLKGIAENYSAVVDRSGPENGFWFRSQVIQVAKELGYYADSMSYAQWVRLRVREERQSEIVLSFHSLGTSFRGVVAASAFLDHRDRNEDGIVTLDGPYKVSQEPFQFTYTEAEEAILNRFRDWLDRVILEALDMWRKQL